MHARVVSISEAARLTGLSRAAIRRRVAQGDLRAVRRAGRSRISVDELAERGLLDAPATPSVAELLDRLESQAVEIGRLRTELWLAQRRLAAEELRRGRRERRPV